MPYRKQGQSLVVFHLEGLLESGKESFQLVVVVVEAEREHQGRGLDHIGVDVELVAGGEDLL